jgi:outer membrane protein OmpA-like peptidoglycan-associated protein
MRYLVSVFLIFIVTAIRSQSLLVNGGFEEPNVCTEFNVECAPEGWISSNNGFTIYFKDAKRSHESFTCMAIEAGNFHGAFYRTLIRSQLLCGMRKDARYKLEFFIKTPYDLLDSVGVLFTEKDPLFEKTPIHKLKPDIFLEEYVQPLKIKDSAWHRITIDYIATGQERFIAFAYFAKNDFITERIHPRENRFFVFFDDISLVPLDPKEKLCSDHGEMKEAIYAENERHDLMEKKIRYYKLNPPQPPEISRNSYIRIDTLVLPDILFASGKAELQTQSHTILDEFYQRIGKAEVDSIVIEGHTDSVGTYARNEKLALDRAISVQEWLSKKMDSKIIRARGWAFLRPIAENKTEAGRRLNRRVEVFLYLRE